MAEIQIGIYCCLLSFSIFRYSKVLIRTTCWQGKEVLVSRHVEDDLSSGKDIPDNDDAKMNFEPNCIQFVTSFKEITGDKVSLHYLVLSIPFLKDNTNWIPFLNRIGNLMGFPPTNSPENSKASMSVEGHSFIIDYRSKDTRLGIVWIICRWWNNNWMDVSTCIPRVRRW